MSIPGSDRPARVAVIGGGISGLAAAYFLCRDAGETVEVTVYEESARIGGKLRTSEVAGVPVDEGADTLLARRPEGVALARAVGLGEDLVTPETTEASVWVSGAQRPMPRGHLMGVPGDLRAVAASGVLSLGALARLPLDYLLPRTPVSDDVAVGRYVAARLGREVVNRLVEPLLGGVYAGHADELSLDATVPQLAQIARSERSLIEGVRQLRASAPTDNGSVFSSVRGGLGRLPVAVAGAAAAAIRTRATVRNVRRTPAGWRLTVGPSRHPELIEVDAVVLAVPARPAARLLRDDVPAAAAHLVAIDYASVALVTLALPYAELSIPPSGSGFLVPPVEGRLLKAATYSSNKWAYVLASDPDVFVVRLSFGRYGEEEDLQRDDDELVAAARAELAAVTGVNAEPLDSRVSRWGGSLPQYTVGHCDRVVRARTAVAQVPGLALCGAAYDGVGVAACVASAESAAKAVVEGLERVATF